MKKAQPEIYIFPQKKVLLFTESERKKKSEIQLTNYELLPTSKRRKKNHRENQKLLSVLTGNHQNFRNKMKIY